MSQIIVKFKMPSVLAEQLQEILRREEISPDLFICDAIRQKLSAYAGKDPASLDCWEYMRCGREEGGDKAHLLGICPAYPDKGKRCASVVGTFCGGVVQGLYAAKYSNCSICEFYKSRHYDADSRIEPVEKKKGILT